MRTWHASVEDLPANQKTNFLIKAFGSYDVHTYR